LSDVGPVRPVRPVRPGWSGWARLGQVGQVGPGWSGWVRLGQVGPGWARFDRSCRVGLVRRFALVPAQARRAGAARPAPRPTAVRDATGTRGASPLAPARSAGAACLSRSSGNQTERSEGWCRKRGSNPHSPCGEPDFESNKAIRHRCNQINDLAEPSGNAALRAATCCARFTHVSPAMGTVVGT
jgi:hypothetical protein